MAKWTWLEELGVRGAPPTNVKFAAYTSSDVALFRHGGCTGVGRALTAGVLSDVAMYHLHQRRWYTSLCHTPTSISSSSLGTSSSSSLLYDGEHQRRQQQSNENENVILMQRNIWTGSHYDLTDAIASAEAAAAALNIKVPARYHHCAMAIPMSSASAAQRVHGKSDAVLLIHGGKNELGHECSDLWSFHLLPSGRGYWRQLDSVVSGVQPPQMFGHKAVLIDGGDVDNFDDDDDGKSIVHRQHDVDDMTWAIVGLVANNSSTSSSIRGKRSRSTSPTPSSSSSRGKGGEGGKGRAPSHRIEVYTLTYGVSSRWRIVTPTTGLIPPPRRDYLLSTGQRPPQGQSEPTLLSTTHNPQYATQQLILVGGSSAKTECNDAWIFDLKSESWREITFAASPSISPSLSSSTLLGGGGAGGCGLFLESLHKGAQLIPAHHWLWNEAAGLDAVTTTRSAQSPRSSCGMWLSFSGQICCCLLWRPRASSGATSARTLTQQRTASDDQMLLEVIPLTSSIGSLAPGPFNKQLAAVWILPTEESPVPIELVNKCRLAASEAVPSAKNTSSSAPPPAAPLLEEIVAIGGITSTGQIFRMSVTSEMLRPSLAATMHATRGHSTHHVPGNAAGGAAAVASAVTTGEAEDSHTSLLLAVPPLSNEKGTVQQPDLLPGSEDSSGGDDEDTNLLDDLFD
ncbi:Hypothetical protein, putative [Bodo saltans]|uniref:Uncharacterized protein n=1 Tax=Bodo saltans TaxID=75058 RepID=A0A0S4JHT2_BODSA|nr:Hypothetical protein, putative [Bodo saltans]|eukprot:CUG89700.1 Hypothetical protein, putative [Bodo saltans]